MGFRAHRVAPPPPGRIREMTECRTSVAIPETDMVNAPFIFRMSCERPQRFVPIARL